LSKFGEGEDEENSVSYYDEVKGEMTRQFQANRTEFEGESEQMRGELEGFKPGSYVRIVLNSVPYEFIHNFSPKYPIVAGALLAGEDNMGFVQVFFF